jgi:DNA-binding XRE family transcriptional regulator
MDKNKRKRLEEKGWQVGTVADFLGLTPEESTYVELKLALSANLRKWREEKQLTQVELAERIQSSQSRVAKMEAGDPSVSLDLLVRTLFALGVTRDSLAQMIITSAVPVN